MKHSLASLSAFLLRSALAGGGWETAPQAPVPLVAHPAGVRDAILLYEGNVRRFTAKSEVPTHGPLPHLR